MINNKYSFETNLEAIRLLNEGFPGRTICKKLGLKSNGLIHTWRKHLRNNNYQRLRQPAGKQYKYHTGDAELPLKIRYELDMKQKDEELAVKKNLIKKGLW